MCLALLTAAIVIQVAMATGGGPPLLSVVSILIVFVISLSMWTSGRKSEEEKAVSNEEIERESLNKRDKTSGTPE